MSQAEHALRAKLKAAKARIAELETIQATGLLDAAAKEPGGVYLATLAILRHLGEGVQPHDSIVSKLSNIVAAKNSAMQQMKELMQTPASQMLKDALHVIGLWRKNTSGMHVAAMLFLDRPIIKALLREMEAEKSIEKGDG